MDHNREEETLRITISMPKGMKMSQVQFSGTFVVAPQGGGGGTLQVNPTSEELDLQVGVAADGEPVCAVTGGTPPYNYALDPSSGALPDGITFENDDSGNVTLAGTPTTPGTSLTPVLLNITDSATPAAQASVKLRTAIKKK
jgi:hypothetical protein